MRQEIKSIGIDIGTSTTQLVFSRIVVENVAGSYNVPRVSIVDKEVIYRSKIYFTPLRSATEIDAEAVKKIVKDEYESAGMTPADLSTGAVIITGETARKQNANEVLEALSDFAGDFVVATAGPDLESVSQRCRYGYYFRGTPHCGGESGCRRRHDEHRRLSEGHTPRCLLSGYRRSSD